MLPQIKAKKLGSKSGLTQTREDGGVYLAPNSGQSSEQALNDEDIKRLGKLITRVFDALGNGEEPQDIEWAFDGNDFVLLQARPVTNLPDCTFVDLKYRHWRGLMQITGMRFLWPYPLYIDK